MNKKKSILKYVMVVALLCVVTLPTVALAFDAGDRPQEDSVDFDALIEAVFSLIWPIFMGFAIVMFMVAGFQFLTAGGEAGKVAQARQSVIWGVVGVIVGILAFSIPFVVQDLLGA